MRINKVLGFTLLEILIALFIFTILSLMLATALHHVINIQSGTEWNAERLRQLQMTLVRLSRDIEQAVDRPIVNANAKNEEAFVGGPDGVTFTHMGFANSSGVALQSSLQRTRYTWKKGELWRQTWMAVDMAPNTPTSVKPLIEGVTEIRFEYLDKENHLRSQWPVQGQKNKGLPKAVKVTFTLEKWGNLTQLYIIPVQPKQDEKEKSLENNNEPT